MSKKRQPPRSGGWVAAGSRVRHFIGEMDSNRRVMRRLSGRFSTLGEALQHLAWARRRNPRAVILRDVLMLEVLE